MSLFPHPSDATHKIWSRLANWVQRYSSLKVWMTTTDDDNGQTTDHWYTISSGELKIGTSEIIAVIDLRAVIDWNWKGNSNKQPKRQRSLTWVQCAKVKSHFKKYINGPWKPVARNRTRQSFYACPGYQQLDDDSVARLNWALPIKLKCFSEQKIKEEKSLDHEI